MRDIVLFATELYALPILRPLARGCSERGLRPWWWVTGALSGHLQPGDLTIRSPAEAVALSPSAVIGAANWVPHFLSGMKVQVFHGFNVEKRDGNRGHFRLRGLFDLYCTQGPATTAPFMVLAQKAKYFSVVETGWPKLDPLFQPDAGEQTASAALRPSDGRKVVMYASTFTESLSSAPLLFDTLAQHVRRGDYYWLLTLHPKCPPDLVARYRSLTGPNACFLAADQLIAMQRAADILLCDTSSVISEFVVQHKPVVTFRNRMPRPHMLNITALEELPSALAQALSPAPALRTEIRRYAGEIHPYRDGRSSERVLDAVAAVTKDHLRAGRRKPWAPMRKLQIRSRLGYWGRSGKPA